MGRGKTTKQCKRAYLNCGLQSFLLLCLLRGFSISSPPPGSSSCLRNLSRISPDPGLDNRMGSLKFVTVSAACFDAVFERRFRCRISLDPDLWSMSHSNRSSQQSRNQWFRSLSSGVRVFMYSSNSVKKLKEIERKSVKNLFYKVFFTLGQRQWKQL